MVFFEDFLDESGIDVAGTGVAGFNWYPQQWFGGPVTDPSAISVENSVLTLSGWLQSAIAKAGSPFFTGSVFGGGAYFEASIAFDPTKGANASYWPSFWSLAIEHVYDSVTTADEQWPGQAPGYAHFVELDFFEAIGQSFTSYAGKTSYKATIHDWSGVYTTKWPNDISNAPFNDFAISNYMASVDWSAFHTYGCLWAPQAGDNPGYVQWFFDGLAGQKLFYSGPVVAPPLPGQSNGQYAPTLPGAAAQTYARLDQQRLAMSLSTDPAWPIMVDWVKVWQK